MRAWIAGWFCVGIASTVFAQSPTLQHTVEEGETLWSIAARSDIYADPYLWPVIYKFNRDQIQDPKVLYPGQVLQIPIQIDEKTKATARREAHPERAVDE